MLPLAGFRGKGGNIAIITALSMTLVIGCGALAVDVGALSQNRRSLQSANDAAVMAAVIPILQSQTYGVTPDTSRLTAIVTASLAANGYSNAVVDSVTAGTYCPDSTLAPSARFTAGNHTCANGVYSGPVPNAAQATVHILSPYYLARVLIPGATSQTVSVTSTAVGMDEAGFVIGTGLISASTANSALLNGVLGGMLGSTVSLSAVSYDGLANTQINALNFLNPIATNASVNVGTISGLANASAKLSTVLSADTSAINSGTLTTAATNALTGLAGLSAAVYGSASVQIGQLLNAAAWQTTASGGSSAPTALQAQVNAFQVATAAIQLANGSHSVTVPTSGLNLTGLASLTVSSTVGSPSVSGYPGGGLGYVGTTASTSQVNLQIGLTANPPTISVPLIASAQVSLGLPITVTLANGSAKFTSISCGANPASDSVISITGTTGLGTIDANLTANVVITGPLNIVLLNATVLVPITVQLGAGGPTAVSFTQSDIQNQTVKRISSTDVLASTVSSLMTSLGTQANAKISVQVLGLSLAVSNALLAPVTSLVSSSLNALAPTLDTVINNAANALGVQVGYMDIMATGARCGVPAITN